MTEVGGGRGLQRGQEELDLWGANPSLPREHFSTSGIPSSSGFLTRGVLLLSSYQIPPGPLYLGLVVEEMSC